MVQGRTERDPTSVAVLAAAMQMDQSQVAAPPDLAATPFELLNEDERAWTNAAHVVREGQGTFRLRLMQAYGRCAITGEHTPIVLDGAHIQPYRGPRSNHPQNGLLLTKEFHALFDAAYVEVTPDLIVRVSERLRADFKNGHRYYPYDVNMTGPLSPGARDVAGPRHSDAAGRVTCEERQPCHAVCWTSVLPSNGAAPMRDQRDQGDKVGYRDTGRCAMP